MRVLALAFQLTSIVLQFYSIYNISSPRNIKRYYFHSAGECLAATGKLTVFFFFKKPYKDFLTIFLFKSDNMHNRFISIQMDG